MTMYHPHQPQLFPIRPFLTRTGEGSRLFKVDSKFSVKKIGVFLAKKANHSL